MLRWAGLFVVSLWCGVVEARPVSTPGIAIPYWRGTMPGLGRKYTKAQLEKTIGATPSAECESKSVRCWRTGRLTGGDAREPETHLDYVVELRFDERGTLDSILLEVFGTEGCSPQLYDFSEELDRRHGRGRRTSDGNGGLTVRWKGDGYTWVQDYWYSGETGDASCSFTLTK